MSSASPAFSLIIAYLKALPEVLAGLIGLAILRDERVVFAISIVIGRFAEPLGKTWMVVFDGCRRAMFPDTAFLSGSRELSVLPVVLIRIK